MGIEGFILQRVKKEEFEKGRQIEKDARNFEFAKVLLTQTKYNLEKIADMVGVPVAFVERVKESLG